MSEYTELEEKLRRSSTLASQNAFTAYMDYARSVRDELNVYQHMEDNNLGTTEVEYWLKRMEIHQCRCEYVDLVHIIHCIRKNSILREKKDYWLIEEFVTKFENEMRGFLRAKFRRKRTVEEYEKFSFENVWKITRLIGGVEVFVDPEQRQNYVLDDFSEFIEKNYKEHCELERKEYERGQSGKPLSFIGKRIENFDIFSQELINQRRSERRSQLGRHSLRKSNVPESFETPKQKDIISKGNIIKSDSKESHKKNSLKDSAEILQSMRKSLINKVQNSPSFCAHINRSESNEHRNETVPEQELVRDEIINQISIYSFGRANNSNRSSSLSSNSDNAILFDRSFNKESSRIGKQIRKEDFELGLIIKEIQRENYETRTFSSEIDSNQENCQCREEIDGEKIDEEGQRENRRPFSMLRKDEHVVDIEQCGLEELLMLSEDTDELVVNTYEIDSRFKTMRKSTYLNENQFHSEQHTRRASFLSHISEETSYCHSEAKAILRSK